MGPSILLDKSTLNALSREQTLKLTRYFDWILVDILLWEITGNFFKKTKTRSARNEAAILADKIALDSWQNMSSITLVESNLLGNVVQMECKPIIQPDSVTRTVNGQVAAYLDGRSFCDMVYRWQKGEFTEEDKTRAGIWQNIKNDCKGKEATYLQLLTSHHIILPACSDIPSMKFEVDKLVRNPNMQSVCLDILLLFQGMDSKKRQSLLKHVSKQHHSLQVYAPYAFYCVQAFLLFLGALRHNLVKKDTNDRIDIEYLFYLPFCKVFSSNDNLHKKLASQLLKEDQVFVTGDDLKKGIENVDNHPIYDETMHALCEPIPPMNRDSSIREMWRVTKWLYS
jgi:hypothetical protein